MSNAQLPPHGNTVYPWPLWVSGSVHRVKQGKHFNVTTKSFCSSLRCHARRKGLSVETRVKGGTVTFRFFPRDSE